MPSPKPRGHLRRDGAAPFRSRPGTASPAAMARLLRRLQELGGSAAASIPEQVAAHLAIDPLLTDATLAQRFSVDEPLIARVRANIASGRPPGHGLLAESPPDRPGAPETGPERAGVPPGPPGPPRAAQPLSCGELRASLPTYTVTGDDGTVHSGLRYREATIMAKTYGGRLVAEQP
jgi:hypothetical protein